MVCPPSGLCRLTGEARAYGQETWPRRLNALPEVLAESNEILLADELSLDGGFVTASVAHLSWLAGKLRVVIASAGHPAAVLLRSDGGIRMLSGGGLPLGLFADPEPASQELTLLRHEVARGE